MKRLKEYIGKLLFEADEDKGSDNDDLFSGFGDTGDSDNNEDSNEDDKEDPEEDDKEDPEEDDTEDSDEDDKEDSDEDEPTIKNHDKVLKKEDIIFDIWETLDKKVTHLKSNTNYLKIEYKYYDKKKHVEIDFLLGYDKKDKSWKLWCGKIGALTYNDDPYISLNTNIFNEAIILSLDKIVNYVQDIYDNPDNWPQYYIDL